MEQQGRWDDRPIAGIELQGPALVEPLQLQQDLTLHQQK